MIRPFKVLYSSSIAWSSKEHKKGAQGGSLFWGAKKCFCVKSYRLIVWGKIEPPCTSFFCSSEKWTALRPFFAPQVCKAVHFCEEGGNGFFEEGVIQNSPTSPPHYQLIRLDTKTFFAPQKSEPPCTPFFVLLRKVNRLAPPLNPFKTVLLPTPPPPTSL